MTMITTGAIRKSSTAPAKAPTATTPGPVRCPSSAIMPRRRSSAPLEDALEADDAVVAREADQRQHEQDEGQRGGERPVERDLHLALDQHRDHHVPGAAHERRRDEEAQAQD